MIGRALEYENDNMIGRALEYENENYKCQNLPPQLFQTIFCKQKIY